MNGCGGPRIAVDDYIYSCGGLCVVVEGVYICGGLSIGIPGPV